MGKRFEDVPVPGLSELLDAYRVMGLVNLLGIVGENTAILRPGGGEHLEVECLPGRWTPDELHALRHAAGLA